MNTKLIPFVFSTDENYSFVTQIAITSLLENNKKPCEIIILIDNDVSVQSQNEFKMLEKRYFNCVIRMIPINKNQFANVRMERDYITKATMYRLMLPELLPEYNKCVYLDGDILVLKSLDELLEFEMENYYFAGVVDREMKKANSYADKIGLSSMDNYINAGVLLINLNLLREKDMLTKFIEHCENEYSFADQDIINVCAQGKIRTIDEKYNTFCIYNTDRKNVSLLHFAGGNEVKPWMNCKSKDFLLWWKYAESYRKTEQYGKILQNAKRFEDNWSWTNILKRCQKTADIYIWGFTVYGEKIYDLIMSWNDNLKVTFLDNDFKKNGMRYRNAEVIQPSFITKNSKDFLVINAVINRKQEVEQELTMMNIPITKVISPLKKTGQYYKVLDEKYYSEEFKDYVIGEHGVFL